MARSSTRLALLLLDQYCGTLVHQTAKCLLTHGPCPLKFLAFKTKQKLSLVRNALSLLLQHKFCTVNSDGKGICQYTISLKKVLGILNYQHYPQIAHDASNTPISHFIVTSLLQEGQMSIPFLASLYHKSHPSEQLKPLEDVFCHLFARKFIEFSQNATTTLLNPDIGHHSWYGESFIRQAFQDTSKQLISCKEEPDAEPVAKRTKLDNQPNEPSPDEIYWSLNHSRFNLELQYQLVFTGLKSYFADVSLVGVAKALIDLAIEGTDISSEVTVAIASQDIVRQLNKNGCKLSRDQVTECLSVFEDDFVPLVRSHDILASGGTYVLETKKVLKKMLGDTFALMVGQKLSSFHARIFRIIRDKVSLPQKLIEELAMVTPKECKEYVFDLVKAGFIKTNYYSRVPDYVPAKTYFVFTVDLDQVAKRTFEECCHAIYNSITRRLHEVEQNRHLIDRKKYVDVQIETLSREENSEQQIEDLRSSFTSHDLEVIQKAEESIKKLEMAELQVTNTMTLVISWLSMQNMFV